MKKVLVFLILVIIFVSSACGSNSTSTKEYMDNPMDALTLNKLVQVKPIEDAIEFCQQFSTKDHSRDLCFNSIIIAGGREPYMDASFCDNFEGDVFKAQCNDKFDPEGKQTEKVFQDLQKEITELERDKVEQAIPTGPFGTLVLGSGPVVDCGEGMAVTLPKFEDDQFSQTTLTCEWTQHGAVLEYKTERARSDTINDGKNIGVSFYPVGSILQTSAKTNRDIDIATTNYIEEQEVSDTYETSTPLGTAYVSITGTQPNYENAFTHASANIDLPDGLLVVTYTFSEDGGDALEHRKHADSQLRELMNGLSRA